ncbi:MAG: hypothetical protein JSV10_10215 [Candidatus Zixiibacteriota bacterium]|nr:MAG: hypothetical protein JSV10_10215 [candidate division Zixibacteria bacterium]
MKGRLKRLWVFLLLSSFAGYPSEAAFCRDRLSGSDQNLAACVSYLTLRKDFVYLPVTWKSSMVTAAVVYKLRYGRFRHSFQITYGQGNHIRVNGRSRPGDDYFLLWDLSYDFVWYKARSEGRQKLSWGLGFSVQSLQLRQKVRVSSGKQNEHRDEFWGVGPVFGVIRESSERKLSAGLHVSLLAGLPGASKSIIKSEGLYSDESYLHWLKMKCTLELVYGLSQTCGIEFRLTRETYVYGRCQGADFRLHRSFSGGTLLFNSCRLGLRYDI